MSSGRQTAGRPRWTQTWLGGARSAGAELGYPGQRLGLPEHGSHAVAGYGRRLVALFVDWGLCMLISAFLARAFELPQQDRSLLTLGLFGLQALVLTATIGMTLGKRLCGIRVVRLDGHPIGPLRALARTLLLLAVVPALFWDRDHRGLHDRASDTVVINL
jgi:uncharacterized RDD family membrane protein YckC